jgi:hypothetical protein
MPAIERYGLSFHYLDEGHPSGRPFVFQHGLGATFRNPQASFRPVGRPAVLTGLPRPRGRAGRRSQVATGQYPSKTRTKECYGRGRP